MAGADIHVLPINDLVDHDETPGCWCQPTVSAICPECEDVHEDGADCWYCGGSGIVTTERAPGAPVMVVHNAADGRE